MFTILKRPEKCFQCLQIWERHENVLQFKLGECLKTGRNTKDKCKIPDSAPVETLLKLTGPDVPCPFSGSFNFTYKKDGKECSRVNSEVVSCMSEATSLLKFEVCPDDVKQESGDTVFYNTIIGLEGDSQEMLTCKATWESDLNSRETYMMGTLDYRYKRSNEERVRCFLVQETRRGIQVAQSSDGTCYNNLQSSQSGHRTLRLSSSRGKETRQEETSCHFPRWARDMGPLLSFSFSSKYEFSADGTILSLGNYSTVSNRSHEMSRTNCVKMIEEEEGHYVKMVTRVRAKCDQMFKCMRIFKRTENILELQEGSPTNYQAAACSPQNFDEKLMIYTTLFKENLQAQPCPINGVHNVSFLDLDGQAEVCAKNGFTNINIKCKEQHLMEFYKNCPSPDPAKNNRLEVSSRFEYHCLGGWSERRRLFELPSQDNYYLSNNYFPQHGVYTTDQEHTNNSPNITLGYVVAMRALNKPDGTEERKRICFIYMKLEEPDQWGTTYSWTVDKTACLRNIRSVSKAMYSLKQTTLGRGLELDNDSTRQYWRLVAVCGAWPAGASCWRWGWWRYSCDQHAFNERLLVSKC